MNYGGDDDVKKNNTDELGQNIEEDIENNYEGA